MTEFNLAIFRRVLASPPAHSSFLERRSASLSSRDRWHTETAAELGFSTSLPHSVTSLSAGRRCNQTMPEETSRSRHVCLSYSTNCVTKLINLPVHLLLGLRPRHLPLAKEG